MIALSRRGSILIVVVGMVGIMAAVCLTFLAKARTAAAEMGEFSRTAQARICLAAACAYVQETSRIGWDDPTTPEHEEAFGWVDVRDGQPGPRTTLVAQAQYDAAGNLTVPAIYRDVISPTAVEDFIRPDGYRRPLWPNIGGVSRHPLYRMVRPPFAISQDVTPNAIENNPAKPLFGLPLLRKPDPLPATRTSYEDFAAGDTSPSLEMLDAAGSAYFAMVLRPLWSLPAVAPPRVSATGMKWSNCG